MVITGCRLHCLRTASFVFQREGNGRSVCRTTLLSNFEVLSTVTEGSMSSWMPCAAPWPVSADVCPCPVAHHLLNPLV